MKIKDMPIRVISAAIMLAIVIPLIIIGKIPYAIGIGLIALLAFLEISKLNNYPVIIRLLSFISLILITYSNFDANMIINGLSYKTLSISLLLIFIPIVYFQPKGRYTVNDAFKLLGFIILVGLGLNYLILVRNMDLKYLLFVLLIPIITDTFAFISGSLVGNHKFTKISPKKSIEGCLIGSAMGTFVMTMFYTTFIGNQSNIFIIIGLTLLMTIIGQVGDLFFSAIKREYNIKDFSKLIPGHGGILDRLDSIIFVVICFMIFIDYL